MLETESTARGAPALAAPPADAARCDYDLDRLRELRRFVTRGAAAAGLSERRVTDLVTAAAELGANSVMHGGGSGTALLWREGDAIVLEARDAGHIADPDAGSSPPAPTQDHGRGLWIARRLCDSVQIRSSESGTAVRVRLGLD